MEGILLWKFKTISKNVDRDEEKAVVKEEDGVSPVRNMHKC